MSAPCPVFVFLLTFILALLAPGSSQALPSPIPPPRGTSCVSLTQFRDTLLVVERTRSGEIFRTFTIDLPGGADSHGVRPSLGAEPDHAGTDSRRILISGRLNAGDCIVHPSTCLPTRAAVYIGADHFLFQTFVLISSGAGLINIYFDEQHLPRELLAPSSGPGLKQAQIYADDNWIAICGPKDAGLLQTWSNSAISSRCIAEHTQ